MEAELSIYQSGTGGCHQWTASSGTPGWCLCGRGYYTVNAIARQVNLDYVQLHGHEEADYARKVERPVIKAYRYGEDFSVEAANTFPAELILVDAFKPGLVGGTGEAFDWRAAAEDIAAINKSVLIAGGINAENVHEVEKIFHPFAVDVSGSLEVDHEKSIDRIKSFMKKIK